MTKKEKLLNGFSIEFEIGKTAKNKTILYQMNPRNGFAVLLWQWVFDWKFQSARG